MTLSQLVERVEGRLEAAGLFFGHGTDNAFDEAAWLVAHAAGIDLAESDDLPWERPLADAVVAAAETLLEERLDTRLPLAYLIREAWFAGERFYVDERVIVPRSHLGEWIPERFEPWIDARRVGTILDLCTGSGCIAVALARAFPDADVDAADLSVDALQVARRNIDEHGLGDRVQLYRGDLFAPVAGKRYDLVVCNPPYVADDLMSDMPEEFHHEPELAFRGGSVGLDIIGRILADASEHLSAEGVLIVEAGSAGVAVEEAYPGIPFSWLSVSDGDDKVFLVDAANLERLSPD